MLLSQAAAVVASILALAPALAATYLVMLTVAACVAAGRTRLPRQASSYRHFAVLVPAHNEQALIGRLLASLAGLDYPAAHFDVWVVADNCDDATAAVARDQGAHVLERFDTSARSKGFALRWLLESLREQRRQYDAYVILDADSVVAPNFLSSMNARLESGSQVIQAYYSVLNAEASPIATLRFLALAAVHYLRPLGRSILGLSVGLKGNGMCFAASVVERFGWNWFTLAEDVEFHLELVRSGLRVDFAPETCVLADMPVTLHQAASQNDRWERGRVELVRRFVPALLAASLRNRSLIALDAAIEQLIPPLSVPLVFGAIGIAAGAVLHLWLPVIVGLVSVVGQVGYLLVAAALVRAPATAYAALAYAPVYVLWKLWLYVMALVTPRTQDWVRTARTPETR